MPSFKKTHYNTASTCKYSRDEEVTRARLAKARNMNSYVILANDWLQIFKLIKNANTFDPNHFAFQS